MEHRSSTSTRHLTLFCAVSFASRHVSSLSSNSDILVRLQVCRSLPLLRFPCGFHSRALLATCPSGLLSVLNTCNFCFNPLVSLQVPEPYKSTAFTFDLKILNLVRVVSAVDRHTGFSIANACLAFPMRAWISSSVPPFLLTILPRYVNSSTSSTRSPAINTLSPRLVPIRNSFVFAALIFKPTFAPCSSKARVLPSCPVFCVTVGPDHRQSQDLLRMS